jgi:hypothetical protein
LNAAHDHRAYRYAGDQGNAPGHLTRPGHLAIIAGQFHHGISLSFPLRSSARAARTVEAVLA